VTHTRAAVLGLCGLIVLVLAAAQIAETASNTVPATKAGVVIHTNSLNEGKPSQCNGIFPTNLVVGTSWTVNGSDSGDLLLGGIGARTLNGRNGNDCIVGGNTTTRIDGGNGTDVCIGRTGTQFISCSTTVIR